MRAPRPIEDVIAETEKICDALGYPIEPGIKDLVIGLRRWGINITMSCEGHHSRGLPFPWVTVAHNSLMDLVELVGLWNAPAFRNRRIPWFFEPAGPAAVRIRPEVRGRRNLARLRQLQKSARAFGKMLQELPDSFFRDD